MSVMRPDLYPPKPDINLAVPGDKVRHNFDPGTFKVIDCDLDQGIMTVIRESDSMENPMGRRPVTLPHVVAYQISEMRLIEG